MSPNSLNERFGSTLAISGILLIAISAVLTLLYFASVGGQVSGGGRGSDTSSLEFFCVGFFYAGAAALGLRALLAVGARVTKQ